MAKNLGLSCPLCLDVSDPDDFLAVAIPHARIAQSEPSRFCRRCVLVIMKTAVASDLIDPREVFGDADATTESASSSDTPAQVPGLHAEGVREPDAPAVGERDSEAVRDAREVQQPGDRELEDGELKRSDG